MMINRFGNHSQLNKNCLNFYNLRCRFCTVSLPLRISSKNTPSQQPFILDEIQFIYSKWNQNETMPKNITVKNIPDSLIKKIEASSNKNRRSINSEIIFQLEQKLTPSRRAIPTLKQIDSLRAKTKPHYLTETELRNLKNEGRAEWLLWIPTSLPIYT